MTASTEIRNVPGVLHPIWCADPSGEHGDERNGIEHRGLVTQWQTAPGDDDVELSLQLYRFDEVVRGEQRPGRAASS